MGLPQAIKQARTRAGLTQAALAERLGRTQALVSSWEKGKTSLSWENMLAVAKACGITAEELVAEASKGNGPGAEAS